jgi:hypothetical protein
MQRNLAKGFLGLVLQPVPWLSHIGETLQPTPELAEAVVKSASASPHSIHLSFNKICHVANKNSAWFLQEAKWGIQVPGSTFSKRRYFKVIKECRLHCLKINSIFFKIR